MNAIHGTLREGKVEFDELPSWPEGSRVYIQLDKEEKEVAVSPDDDPESIQRWLAWYDTLEPLVMTAKEEKEWENALREMDALSQIDQEREEAKIFS